LHNYWLPGSRGTVMGGLLRGESWMGCIWSTTSPYYTYKTIYLFVLRKPAG
jgi:hypothetical protein